MKRNWIAAVGLLLAMVCWGRTSMAIGDNLVSNGTFDTDLAGWTKTYGPSQWSPDDADGAPDSGSAELEELGGGRTVRLTSDCVTVVGGARYLLGVAQRSQYIFGSPVHVRVDLVWAEDASCDVPISRVMVPSLSTAWTTTSKVVSAPANAASASVVLAVFYDNRAVIETDPVPRAIDPGNRFDNIVFAPHTPSGTSTTSSTTNTSTTTTSTTLACGGNCGDPIGDATETAASDAAAGLVTSSDALYVLQAAVGELTCQLCICDVNDSGNVSATDALLTLAASTGGPVSLTCPQ